MSEFKTLKFKFEIDHQSFNQVKQAVQSLTSELQKMGAAGGGLLGGMNVGGKSPGTIQSIAQGNQKSSASSNNGSNTQSLTMGKVILDNANAFKKFAQEGKGASKVMTDALKRDMEDQVRSLSYLETRLKALGDQFDTVTKKQQSFLASGDAAGAKKMAAHADMLREDIADVSGQTLKTHSSVSQTRALLASTAPSQSVIGQFAQFAGYTGLGIPTSLGGMARLGGMALGGATLALQTQIGWDREGLRSGAERGQMVGRDIAANRSGNVSLIQARQFLAANPALRKEYEKGLPTNTETDGWGMILNAAAGSTGLGSLGTMALDAFQSKTGINLSNSHRIARFGQAIMGTVGDVAGNMTAGAIGTAGGGPLGSRFTDAAMGNLEYMDQRQQLEMAMQHQDFRDRFQYGTQYFEGAFGSRVATARARGLKLGTDKLGRWHDFYGEEDVALTRQGRNVDTKTAIEMQLRQMGGRTLSGYAMSQYAAQEAGNSGYASALLALARSQGGNMNAANALVLSAVGSGRGGTRMGTQAGFSLAETLGGYDPRLGAIDTTGMLNQYMTGIGGSGNTIKDANQVAAFSGGLGLLGSYTTGSRDNLQSGKNILFASQILGEGASASAKDYLATLDPRQLAAGARGNISQDAKNMGLTQSDFQQMQNKVLGSMFDDSFDNIGGAVGRWRKSGLSVSEYLKANPGERGLLKANLNASNHFRETDTADALLGMLGGDPSGRGMKKGGVGGGPLDEATLAKLNAEAETKKEDSERLVSLTQPGNNLGLTQAYKVLKSEREALEKFAGNGSALVTALEKLRLAIEGKGGGWTSGGKAQKPD